MTAPAPAPSEQEAADRTAAANLPAPLSDGSGFIDVDRLRVLAPQVRDGLIAAMRSAATELRASRGTVIVPEDTYDLVRRLTAAEEVMRQWQQAFDAAAKEAVALLEEEALTAVGGLPGYEEAPSGSLFVPDGEGRRIAVSPDWKPGESTWDVGSLVGWLIEEEVSNHRAQLAAERRRRQEERQAAADPNGEGVQPLPLDPVAAASELAWYESDAQQVAHEVALRLLDLGRFTPSVTKIESLRKKLAGQQRDADAAVLRQVRSVGLRQYRGVKVTREDTK